MEISRKEWNVEEIKSECGKTIPWFSINREPILYQPSFGFSIGWNEPKKPWKPFVVIDLWNIRIDIGWLF